MAKLGRTIANVIRGDTRQINLTFLQSDGTTPVNLAGGTIYFTINESSDPSADASAVLQKTATSFTTPASGYHELTLTHDDTDIAAGTYWYDAQFKDAVGNYLSSYRGKFVVQSDITRT